MRQIHLVNPLDNMGGGSEQRALALYRLLSPHAPVSLWSTSRPDPRLAALVPVRPIRPLRGQFPWRGTLVFVGAYYWLTSWVRLVRPERLIVIYNLHDPSGLAGFLRRVAGCDLARVEMVYASEELRQAAGRPGVVEASLIDLQRFQPRPRPERPFTVGRLSRDTREKFAPSLPAMLGRLAKAGIQVRIMGGTILAGSLGEAPGVSLLPALHEPAEAFLAGLDCFFYQTHPDWVETFGRVVFEAMASAVVPVVSARGDYARYIRHGENGFLFDTDDDAFGHIMALRDDPALRARMGAAARQTVEAMFDDRFKASLLEFYLGKGPPAADSGP
jgi:glycosyltransferase involved in cell wall biosynthesis